MMNSYSYGSIDAIKQKGKVYIRIPAKREVICLLMWIVLAILAGANTYNLDLKNGKAFFTYAQSVSQGEWLYYLALRGARALGLSFELYRLILFSGAYILIYFTIKYYCRWTPFLIILYILYPFAIDVVQAGNFLSMALFAFSTRFLQDKSKIANKVKYIVAIILAAGFHITAYIYLPIVFLPDYYREENGVDKTRKLLLLFFFIGASVTLFDRLTNFVPGLVTRVLNNDVRLSLYFSGYTRFGFILFWFAQIGLCLMAYIAYSGVVNKPNINERNKKYSYGICMITIYGFLLMPIVGYSATVFRVIRNYMLLSYSVWLFYVDSIDNNKIRLIYKFVTLLFLIIIFVFLLEDSVKENMVQFFANNWIF